MIVLDTTVLVYAQGSQHSLREPARRVIAAVGEGRLSATTTTQVVQEFAHVYARRRGRRAGVTAARRYADLLAPLLIVEAATLEEGLRLYDRTDVLGAFDCVLAAAALEAGADALLSGDRGFGAVARLPFVDLGGQGLERLA